MAEKKRWIKAFVLVIAVLSISYLSTVEFTEAQEEQPFNLTQFFSTFKRINKVTPTIEITFQEKVALKNATLYAITDALMQDNNYLFQQFVLTGDAFFLMSMKSAIIPITTNVERSKVSVTPVEPVFNGYLILKLDVTDLIGNPTTHYEYLYLNATETIITIVEPRIGVSNKTVNNLTIRTTREGRPENSQCKIGVDNPAYNFNSLALKPFETPLEMKPVHTFNDIFTAFKLKTSGLFYIICRDQTLNRVNQKKFSVYIDTVPPIINSLTFVPEKIVEYPEYGDQISVMLDVRTNEPVICRYSVNKDQNYTDRDHFGYFNPYDFEAFKDVKQINYTLPPVRKGNRTFYIECEDRAGWKSNIVSKRVYIDLSSALGMTVVFPPRYTKNKSINFVVSTKRS
ncbi:hypothetical protein ACFL96_19445, partial [Thermoproteota archaeon]